MKRSTMLFAALAAVAAVLAVTVAPEVSAAILDPQSLAMLAIGAGAFGSVQLHTSKELRAQRQSLVEENRKVLEKIAAEKDAARVKELETEWDKRDADIVDMTKKIQRAEKQESLEEEGEQPVRRSAAGREMPGKPNPEQQKEIQERYKQAYWDNLRGFQLEPEDMQLLAARRRSIKGNAMDLERRAMSTTVAAGGYAIPEGFVNQLEATMLHFGGVRPLARILPTEKGNTLPWPTVNDTANEAAIVSEAAALTSPQDPTFSEVSFGAYMYRTLVLASFELLNDEAVNLESFIMDAIAERFARGENRHFTTGNGTTQPHGFIPASSSGVTAASATSVSYADLVDLEHSVDPAYRRQPGVAFQMNDTTLKIIKKLLDADNRPLWSSGVAVREPDTILGYPYAINQHMADVAASNKSIAFGAWKKFVIRQVRDLMIVRANELHLANGQVGFYAFHRVDSKMLDAGTDPVKHLTHPSPN